MFFFLVCRPFFSFLDAFGWVCVSLYIFLLSEKTRPSCVAFAQESWVYVPAVPAWRQRRGWLVARKCTNRFCWWKSPFAHGFPYSTPRKSCFRRTLARNASWWNSHPVRRVHENNRNNIIVLTRRACVLVRGSGSCNNCNRAQPPVSEVARRSKMKRMRAVGTVRL